MSNQSIKSKQTKHNPVTIELEDHLQRIVNSLARGFDTCSANDSSFKQFEAIFEKSNTLEDIIKAISQLIDAFVETVGSAISREKQRVSVAGNQNSNKSLKNTSLLETDSNYEGLEKVLQKYEAEIRDHIRIEQQLKIYSESLEEKIGEIETSNNMKTAKIDVLETDNQRIQKELVFLRNENYLLDTKMKSMKVKENGNSLPRQSKNNSIDTVKLLEFVQSEFESWTFEGNEG